MNPIQPLISLPRPPAGGASWTLRLLGAGLLRSPAVRAQPGSGGPSPGGNPAQVPLDGGASLLLAGGVGYALRRLRKRPR